MIVSLYAVALLFNLHIISASEIEYSYDRQGDWVDLRGSQCGGDRQSPINIMTRGVEESAILGLEALNMREWDTSVDGEWENTGHSLKFTPNAGAVTTTTTTYLGEYELLQFHFHWGTNDTQGSEHQVNGNKYSGELHFVHQITDSRISDTSCYYYTVVGVLLEADERIALEGIWQTLTNTIPEYDEPAVPITNINYLDLLPDDLSYYYYNGSLTTPLCNETVQWVLLQQSLSVPAAFFEKLRTTVVENDTLTHNFRDIQDLNGRTVYQYTDSGASFAIPTIALLLLSILITVAEL